MGSNALAARVVAALTAAHGPKAGHVAPLAPGRVRVYASPRGAGRTANLEVIRPTLARLGQVTPAESKLGVPCLEVSER